MKRRDNVRGVGIPYFSEAEWHKAKAVMADGHTFHDTYAEFIQRVAQVQAELARQHQPTVRVNIDVDRFVAWCRAHGRQVDAHSRQAFAALQAAHQDAGRDAAEP
jgi:hypothetical protein